VILTFGGVLTPLIRRPYTRNDAYRGVAQLVARGVWDAEAGGSSPLTPTSIQILFCRPDSASGSLRLLNDRSTDRRV
jgi:hypothetical protein